MNIKAVPYLIAEIGQAHEGSLGILHSYIDALAKTGVNAVKFQMHIATAESSAQEPFRVQFAAEDDTRFDYWKRMGFTLLQWKNIWALLYVMEIIPLGGRNTWSMFAHQSFPISIALLIDIVPSFGKRLHCHHT